ncbi:hypothetical protein OROHE_008223 [Orobanche hederae]
MKGKAAQSNKPFEFRKPAISKSISSMLTKTPEQVIEERHTNGPSQTILESRLRTKEEKERVHMHIANFFYENVHRPIWTRFRPPTFHDLRLPLLKKAKDDTEKLKEKHEKAWKKYGCTLMYDGWTDRRGRSLINFLANSPEGTFFLGSVNASSESHDAQMLANLLESKIKEIGEKNVVQVVTDNGANYKLAGQILEMRIPTLFWTPCAAHCVDLMLEDIGKIPAFKKAINQARSCTTFIYRHERVLDSMREKTNGRDLVRTRATRFATAFLTLDSLQKKQEPLRFLFCGLDWTRSKLAKTEKGRKVCDTVLSSVFWSSVNDCVNASLPLLQVLRIADGDERPALPEIASAIDYAKLQIKKTFGSGKLTIRNKVVKIIEDRWSSQMGKPLYGAALFLNPGKYFDLLEKNPAYASRIREDFNDVLEKMITDRDTRDKISNFADAYKNTREGFVWEMAIEHRKSKSPLDWWDAYGGRAIELQSFAKRVVGLCASSSGCERNWSTFEFIHTKKRNRLEHQRLNDLVYIQYNRKIDSRFKKRREQGKKFDPLVLEDLEWTNEWTGIDDRFWEAVIASGASESLEGRNFPRRARGGSTTLLTYTRRNTSSTQDPIDEEEEEEDEDNISDDEEVEDDYGVPPEENSQGDGEGDGDDHDFEMDDFDT